MPTIYELMAKMNRQVAGGLERVVRATPEEKFAWSPLEQGRTAQDQVCECVATNFWVAEMLRDRTVPPFDTAKLEQLKAEHRTRDSALKQLEVSTDTLAGAIEAFPAEHLDDTVQLPWEETPSTFAEMMFVPYWNMTYHLGQINYIQTLYGDMDYH